MEAWAVRFGWRHQLSALIHSFPPLNAILTKIPDLPAGADRVSFPAGDPAYARLLPVDILRGAGKTPRVPSACQKGWGEVCNLANTRAARGAGFDVTYYAAVISCNMIVRIRVGGGMW